MPRPQPRSQEDMPMATPTTMEAARQQREDRIHHAPRCTDCLWVHEADSIKRTSFQGVALCPLHASAPALLVVCQQILRRLDNGDSIEPGWYEAEKMREAVTLATKPHREGC